MQVRDYHLTLSTGVADGGQQGARSVGMGGCEPGVVGPAAQTELALSRNDASAPENAKVVPRIVSRCGVNASRRSWPMPTTATEPCRFARKVSATPARP